MKNLLIFALIMFTLSWAQGAPNDKRNCVISAYTAEIGVREATGKNDGERVEQYLASVGFKKGAAWCAAFVHFNLANCDVPSAKSAWSPAYFPASKIIYSNGTAKATIRPGDIFGIYFNNLNRIAHVGFIDEWPEHRNRVTTVEGNTNSAGSREGDGVYRKWRLKSQIYQVANWIG